MLGFVSSQRSEEFIFVIRLRNMDEKKNMVALKHILLPYRSVGTKRMTKRSVCTKRMTK